MIEIAKILADRALVEKGWALRGVKDPNLLVDKIMDLDSKRKMAQSLYDSANSEIKTFSSEIEQLIKSGNKSTIDDLKSLSATAKAKSIENKTILDKVVKELNDILATLPNIPHADVPIGKSADENVSVFEKRFDRRKDFTPLAHWDLAKKYNLIDFEAGNKVAAAGFPFFRGKGAKLMRGLINFLLDKTTAAGYEEIAPPLLVNEASAYGTGQLPDMEGLMYEIVNQNLYLIPTSETPVTNLHRDDIVDLSKGSIKYTAYSQCFRREAGSWGAHVRGLNRLHQFDKVEIVQICKPDDSYKIYEEMLEFLKGVLDELEITYRVLLLCTGDMGAKSSKQYDIEAWSEAQGRWLEISSLSNFENFQANRMGLRYKNSEGKNVLAHTLNGSCFGLPRLYAALIENYQTVEGIDIPKKLQSYVGFDEINS